MLIGNYAYNLYLKASKTNKAQLPKSHIEIISNDFKEDYTQNY